MARRLALVAFALAAPWAAAQTFVTPPVMGVTMFENGNETVRCIASVSPNKHIVLLNRCRGEAQTLEVEFPGKQTYQANFIIEYDNNLKYVNVPKDFAVFHIPDLPEPNKTVNFFNGAAPATGMLYSFSNTTDGVVFHEVPANFTSKTFTLLGQAGDCNHENMLNSIYLTQNDAGFVGKIFIYEAPTVTSCADEIKLDISKYVVMLGKANSWTIENITALVDSAPTAGPTSSPTDLPTSGPTEFPSALPTSSPTRRPTSAPSESPNSAPTPKPTFGPSKSPSAAPTASSPTPKPTQTPTTKPSASPSRSPVPPTPLPTGSPTVPSTSAPTTSPVTGSPIPSTTNDNATIAIVGGVVGGVVLLVIAGGVYAVKRTKVESELVPGVEQAVPIAERISSKPSTPRTPIVPGDDEDEY